MLAHSLRSHRARRLLAATCFAFALSACSALRGEPTVLGSRDGGPVFKTTNCEVVNADGNRCDKKTCKADQQSNCEYFADRCLATGHNYTGTKDAGTCTRVLDN